MKFKNLQFSNSTFSDQSVTKTFSRLIDKSLKRLNGMITRKSNRPLIGFLLRVAGDVGHKVNRFRVIGIAKFAHKVSRLIRSEGRLGTVMYLKTSFVLVQQALGGYVLEDMNPLKRRVRRDRSGFPLFIPCSHRSLLRKRDPSIVRLWLTLLGLYRIIDLEGSLNLSSITDDGPKLANFSNEELKGLLFIIDKF